MQNSKLYLIWKMAIAQLSSMIAEIGDRSSGDARLFRIRGKTLYESKTKKIDGKTKKIFCIVCEKLS